MERKKDRRHHERNSLAVKLPPEMICPDVRAEQMNAVIFFFKNVFPRIMKCNPDTEVLEVFLGSKHLCSGTSF
jgi:hypothetical protein